MGLKESGLRGSLRNVSVGIDAIPDSTFDQTLHQWYFDEGENQSFADAVGDASGSLNFDRWDESGDWVGGFAPDFSDDDDEGIVDSDQENTGDTGLLVTTVYFNQFNTAGNNYIWSHGDTSGDNRLRLTHTDDNKATVHLAADATIESDFEFSTETRYRFGISWDDGDYETYVDGEVVDSGTYGGSLDDITTELWTWGFDDGSGNPVNAIIDNTIIADQPGSENEWQDDYDAQPWS